MTTINIILIMATILATTRVKCSQKLINSTTEPPLLIKRQNLGSFFTYTQQLDVSREYYTQILIVPNLKLPYSSVIRKPDFSFCDFSVTDRRKPGLEICSMFQQTLLPVIQMQQVTIKAIQKIEQSLHILTRPDEFDPDTIANEPLIKKNLHNIQPKQARKRGKRALFGFISEITSYLFGIAKSSEIDELRFMLGDLSHHMTEFNQLYARDQKKMVGIVQTMDEKITSIKNALNMTIQSVKYLEQNTLPNLIDHMTQVSFALTMTAKSALTSLVTLQQTSSILDNLLNLYQQRLQDIYLLYDHQLSPTLVSPDIMQGIINNVSKHLQASYHGYGLISQEAAYYYKHGKAEFVSSEDHLYIIFQMPIARDIKTFWMYETTSVPMQIPNDPLVHTILRDLKPYIAVDQKGEHYVLLTEQNRASCHGYPIARCDTPLLVSNFEQETCTSAVLIGNVTRARRLCNPEIQVSLDPKTHVASLSDGSIFIGSLPASQWVMSCPDKPPASITPCTNCLLTTGCRCEIVTNQHVLNTGLRACNMTPKATVIKTPVDNGMVLQMLDFNNKDINFFNTSNSFSSPSDWKAISGLISKERAASAPMEDVFQDIKNNRPTALTPMKRTQYMINKSLESETKVYFIIVWIELVLIIANIIFCVILHRKVLALTRLILVIRAPTGTAAIKFSEILDIDKFATKISDMKLFIILHMITVGCLLLWILIMLCKLIMYLKAKFRDYRSNCYYIKSPQSQCLVDLVLHISTGQHYVDICLDTLSVDPAKLSFQASRAQTPNLRFQRTSYFAGAIFLEWNHLILHHSDTRQIYHLPIAVPIPALAVEDVNNIFLAETQHFQIMIGTSHLFRKIYDWTQHKDGIELQTFGDSDIYAEIATTAT